MMYISKGLTMLLTMTRATIGLMALPLIPLSLPAMLIPREKGARAEKASPSDLKNLLR